jgi:integrase/recombinase XerD
VRRAHIELYARWLEEKGRARATIARRLSTIVSFYRYAEEERLVELSPAMHVRRPKLDYESRAVGLDRSELGAFLVAAGLGSARDHALASLLALNGLRISEALGTNIEDLAVERGHRTLRVLRKGGKRVTIPLAPRTARAIDLAVGERVEGPIFLSAGGGRLDRHAAARMVRRLARQAGLAKRIGPHSLRHAFITAALDAGATYKRPHPTPTPERRCGTTPRGSFSIATPRTSSPPSSPAPAAETLRPEGEVAPWASLLRGRSVASHVRRPPPVEL